MVSVICLFVFVLEVGGGGRESLYTFPYIITYVRHGYQGRMYVHTYVAEYYKMLYFDLYCECCYVFTLQARYTE